MMAFIGTLNSNPHSHLSNRRILSHTHYVPARSALLKGTAPREQSGGLGRRNKEGKKKRTSSESSGIWSTLTSSSW